MQRAALSLIAALVLAACSSSEIIVAHNVPLATVRDTAVAEAELLDVGIVLFDPGVPEGEVDKEVLEKLIRDGTFVNIRRSESVYMSVLLRDTLQKTGHWGSVWISPKETTAADVTVAARILHSDGDYLRLAVTARDSTGRVWLQDKSYDMSTAAGAFNRQRYPDLDPYQDTFNSIANDLALALERLDAKERVGVRTVTGLRYAADVSPEVFTGYVAQEKGQFQVNRLPAVGDPMFDRTQRVRQRERLFLDTLDQHYAQFSTEAMKPYDSWREYAREEAISVRELTKSTRWRTGMGVATILASIVYGNNSDGGFSERMIRDALMYVGVDMIRAGQVRKQEKQLHTQTLEELSESFEDEVKPLVVEIAGTQHRLTGTAEAQFEEWRALLRQLYIQESGFVPEDVAIYAEPEIEAPVELPMAEDGSATAAGSEVVSPPGATSPSDTAADASASPGDGA